jgi:hypothetical protein
MKELCRRREDLNLYIEHNGKTKHGRRKYKYRMKVSERNKLVKVLFEVATNGLRNYLRENGHAILGQLEGNKNQGYHLIRNSLGPSVLLMEREVCFIDEPGTNGGMEIIASQKQVSFHSFICRRSYDNSGCKSLVIPYGKPVYLSIENAKADPMQSSVVRLPYLSAFFSKTICAGLSMIKAKDDTRLEYMKGSVLSTTTGIEQKDWYPTILHSDFQVSPTLHAENTREPMTFFMALGPDPVALQLGSLTTHPKPVGRIAREKTVILEQGDIILFSWRQWHRTGMPLRWPSQSNLRFHVMLTPDRNDVSGRAVVHEHPHPENEERRQVARKKRHK